MVTGIVELVERSGDPGKDHAQALLRQKQTAIEVIRQKQKIYN